jgi:hypothetical protein
MISAPWLDSLLTKRMVSSELAAEQANIGSLYQRGIALLWSTWKILAK